MLSNLKANFKMISMEEIPQDQSMAREGALWYKYTWYKTQLPDQIKNVISVMSELFNIESPLEKSEDWAFSYYDDLYFKKNGVIYKICKEQRIKHIKEPGYKPFPKPHEALCMVYGISEYRIQTLSTLIQDFIKYCNEHAPRAKRVKDLYSGIILKLESCEGATTGPVDYSTLDDAILKLEEAVKSLTKENVKLPEEIPVTINSIEDEIDKTLKELETIINKKDGQNENK